MTFLLPLPLALLDTFTSHSFFMRVCVCFLASPSHIAFKTHRFFPLSFPSLSFFCHKFLPIFFSFFRITFFFPASHNTTSIFPRFLVSLIFQNYAFHTFFFASFFSFLKKGGTVVTYI